MMHKSITIALVSLGLTLGLPAFAENPARPGTVNYVEGAATLNGQPVTDSNVGTTDLNPGDEFSTQQGKAEILLTPGVFLRLDDNSTVKMISPDLTQTQIELEHGRAGIEVDEIHPENNLDIIDAGVTTRLLKTGYYEFNANQPTALVFDGKASVETGDGTYRDVKSHHELALVVAPNSRPLAKEKPADFNTDANKDELYNWNSLRSQYLAEANNQIAGDYAGGPGFYPGWYWDPYMLGYTYIGFGPFYSPFGWGFYPFGWGGGWYGGRYGGWYGGHGVYRGGAPIHGYAGGGFHGGGFAGGGGFHGGGGFGGGGHR
ncbi:MAG: FecR domain-containing protein [Terracidiphilus sp.]